MLKKSFSLIVMILITISWTMAQDIAVPDGYAGHAGTTGGGNATSITVSTASEFQSAVNNNNPAVIIVKGRLNVGSVTIGSNKTIVGFNSSSGLYGGTVKLEGTNYIIQNITCGPASDDVMEVSGATKVFITKCIFHDSSDELLSIVRGADNVTISWCKFYFNNQTSHSFAHLIGNDDNRTSDRGKLHVTMHHNWYAQKVVERMPRVRFGHVHIYNNYYNSVGNNYCIGTGVECNIRVENTYFDNVNQLWKDWKATTTGGVIGWDNLKLVDSSEPTYIANSFPVFSLPYQFDMDSVEAVKDIVMANAGNVFTTTSVDEIDHTIASEFKLFQNYPNPFNPSTNISFILAKNSHTLIKVYDILGQEIATLVNENLNAGPHTIQLNGSDLESGVYFYNIVAGNYQASKKMMLIK